MLEPLEVFTLDLETECLVLAGRSVTDFVELIQLSLEDDELAAILTLEVNITGLILLEGINDLVEVLVFEEESEVLGRNLSLEVLKRDGERVLIEVLLESTMLISLQLVQGSLLLGDDLLSELARLLLQILVLGGERSSGDVDQSTVALH